MPMTAELWEDKQDAKFDRYTRLAEKYKEESKSAYERSNSLANMIPFGQPILVGHHSEGMHRRHIKKIHSAMNKSVECRDKAEHYKDKVNAMVNNTSISSDDPEVVVKLKAKLKALEEKREGFKEYNKKARKEGTEQLPGWELSNLGQTIRSVKKRIEHLSRVDKIQEVEEKIGEVTFKVDKDENRVQLFFPGKPEEEVRTKLKSNGFKWSPYNGCWQRQINAWAIKVGRDILKELKGGNQEDEL